MSTPNYSFKKAKGIISTFFVLWVLIGLCSSCTRKMEFDEYEQGILDMYQVGDTIMFISDKNEINSSILSDKKNLYIKNPTNSWLPQIFPVVGKAGEITILNLSTGNHRKFISIHKYGYNDRKLMISHGHFNVFIPFNSARKKSFASDCSGSNYGNHKTRLEFCWDKKLGLYSYTDKEGVKWTKYNP